jgi:hypothetical protein
MHRRDLEAFRARLAHHLIVYADQVVAQLREFRPVALVGALRDAILLDTPHPANRVFVGPAAPRTTESLRAVLGAVGEEGAFVEGHDGLYDQQYIPWLIPLPRLHFPATCPSFPSDALWRSR